MKLEKLRIRYVVAAWVIIAAAVLTGLFLSNSDTFLQNLEYFNKVITFVLAPLAVLSAWVSVAQWKVQRDLEAGYKDLHPSGEIEVFGSNGKEEEPAEEEEEEELVEGEEPVEAGGKLDTETKSLTIFRTSKQETSLKMTKAGIECYINDIRPGKGGHQWTMRMSEIAEILEDPTRKIRVSPHSNRVGLLSIGRRKNWLYSTRLFQGNELITRVKNFLENRMSA